MKVSVPAFTNGENLREEREREREREGGEKGERERGRRRRTDRCYILHGHKLEVNGLHVNDAA